MINDGSAIFKGAKKRPADPTNIQEAIRFSIPSVPPAKNGAATLENIAAPSSERTGPPGSSFALGPGGGKKEPFPGLVRAGIFTLLYGSITGKKYPFPDRLPGSRIKGLPGNPCPLPLAKYRAAKNSRDYGPGPFGIIFLDSPAFTGRQYPGHSGLSSWRPSGAPDSGETESGFYGLV